MKGRPEGDVGLARQLRCTLAIVVEGLRKESHIWACIGANRGRAVVATPARMAEAASTETVPNTTAVVECRSAGKESWVPTHEVVVRTVENSCMA